MKKVQVIGFVALIGAGKLKLTPAQAEPRLTAGQIAPTEKEGVFDIVAPVQFKRGEVFGYDGDFSPVVLEDMAPVKDAEAIEAERIAAEKAAKDARIQELEALGEAITEDQRTELDALLAE